MNYVVSASARAALSPLFTSEPLEVDGNFMFSGDADSSAVEAAVHKAGGQLFRVYSDDEASASEAPAEVSEAPAAEVEVAHTVEEWVEEPVATEVETTVETTVETVIAESAPPEFTIPFCARFETSDQGLAFCRAVVGQVSFSEPPTGWSDGRFCILGLARDLDCVEEVAQAHGGSTKLPRVQEATPSEPSSMASKRRGSR